MARATQRSSVMYTLQENLKLCNSYGFNNNNIHKADVGKDCCLLSLTYKLIPCTYSNSVPNQVEAVTSNAPIFPAIRLAANTES